MTPWLQALNDLSAPWASLITRASLHGGATLALVWAWCRLIAPKTPAWLKCWLWRVAYLKVLVSLIWLAPVQLPLLDPPTPVWAETAIASLAPVPAVTDPAAGFVTPPPPLTIAPPAPVRPNWQSILLVLWSIGVMVCVVRLARQLRDAARLRRRCRPTDDPALLAACAQLAYDLGLRRPPAVLLADEDVDVASPLVLGAIRPAIVLPEGLLASCSPRQLRLMLAHELAHVRRHDLAWNWLAAAAETLLFFHPVTWLVRRDWRLAQEVACDEAAVRATGAAPADYARALLCVVEHYTAPPQTARPVAGVVAVGVFESGRALQRRFLAMKSYTHWSPRRRLLAAAIVACVSMIALPAWKVVARAADPPSGASPDRPRPTEPVVDPLSGSSRTSGATGADGNPAADPFTGAADPRGGDAGNNRVLVQSYGSVFALTAEIRPRVNGVVREVNFIEGQRVKRGEVLIQLDDRRERAQLEAAETRLKSAATKLQRVKELHREANVSASTVDEAQAEVEIGKSDLLTHVAAVEEKRLIAPFDGVIAESKAHVGQVLTDGARLALLIEVDALKVQFLVGDAESARIKPGVKIQFATQALSDKTFTGKVYFVSPQSSKGAVELKATLAGTAGSGLRPGMTGMVKLEPAD